MFWVAVHGAIGSPARLYTYPIRTASLVLVLMLQAMVAIAAELVLSTALLNLAFGLQWPLWGPALFAAVLSAAFLAVLWLFEKSGWVVPAMALTVTALGLWFKWHDGPVFGTPTRIWSVVTPGDVLTLGLTTVVAYAVAVVGIARNRCGQPPLSLGFVAWFKRTFSATTSPIGRPFRTPSQAQLWFEWRKKGWAIPATVTIGLVVGLLVWLIASRKAEALYEGLVAAGGLISFVGLLTGFLLGQVGSRDTDLQIGQFLATRPVTSTEMARTILKCEATGLIIAWTIWAASFLALAETLRALQVTFPMRLLGAVGMVVFPGDAGRPVGGHGPLDSALPDRPKGIRGSDHHRLDGARRRPDAFFEIGFFARVAGAILSRGTARRWHHAGAGNGLVISRGPETIADRSADGRCRSQRLGSALRAGRHLRDFTSRPGELCLLPCGGHSGPGRFAARDSSARPGLESEPLARGRPFDVYRGPRQSSPLAEYRSRHARRLRR